MSSTIKQRVAILFGGRSGEHEVSLRSARSVARSMDQKRYEVHFIGIDFEGRWFYRAEAGVSSEEEVLPVQTSESREVLFLTQWHEDGHSVVRFLDQAETISFDVLFPVMHGPLYEDGCLQGMFEIANAAYVGCGVLASSVSMDKETSKRMASDADIPIVPFVSLDSFLWKKSRETCEDLILDQLEFPLFVKPANMGSSVGITKVKERASLAKAIDEAFRYDVKVLVEEGIRPREIEFAVLESLSPGEPPMVSVPGEIIPKQEFYSYDAKYNDPNGADLLVPATLDAETLAEAQNIAERAFLTFGCQGMARVDLFVDQDSGQVYLNEINTLPGFTKISMYPRLCEASGVPYSELITRLVDLAVRSRSQRSSLKRTFQEV